MNPDAIQPTRVVPKNAGSARAMAWAKENRERSREIKRRWRERNPNESNEYRNRKPLKQLMAGARHSAKRRGLEFSISEADLDIVAVCPVLGIELDWTYGGKAKVKGNCPSIDRVDNSVGYIPGNVFIISFRANSLKSNATLQELEAIATYIRTNMAGANP